MAEDKELNEMIAKMKDIIRSERMACNREQICTEKYPQHMMLWCKYCTWHAILQSLERMRAKKT